MTEKFKQDALDAISSLFSDTDADEQTQIDALEEIETLCADNIETLREQLRNNCKE